MSKHFPTATMTASAIFAGLSQKLDYLQDLGVTCLWLLPFFPSPLKDDGYDISDYMNVHPSYGTMDDFQAFLTAAHERDLQVLIELVINHTSDQHPWFQAARLRAAGFAGTRFLCLERHRPRNTRTRALFSPIRRNRTGPGIRWRRLTIGIASSRISRI